MGGKSKNYMVITEGRRVIINDEQYTLPGKTNAMYVSQVKGELYINGYRFKDGKFIFSLRAFWHKLFS